MTIPRSKYQITIKSNGDQIRHRVATLVLDDSGNVLVDMEGFMACPEFPGGGVDIGENFIDAAKRELMEESGWVADDYYVFNYPGDWLYRVPVAERKPIHVWNCEDNQAVVCKAGKFNPTRAFGSEGDVLKCKMIPIPEVISVLKKRLAGNMAERHRIKNQFLLQVLEELHKVNSNEPKWSKWH